MSEYGFLELNGAFVDENDVKEAFELAEDKLSVLNFEIPSYVMEFTLNGVLRTKKFNKYSDFEKEAIVDYIVEFY